ncbi:hypothetical protein VNI00_009298 [Paramarasmius palmivorus]|uniref:NAD(P)-binding protein n=1 Tax=Paramarasmius palmivorus TaxID=297713 RepID=A0AAW0CNZ9_9AGAR
MTSISDRHLLDHAQRSKEKVVVITGGGSGIGKETAIQFAGYGAKIIIGDRDLASAEAVAKEISSSGGQAIAVKCDVTVWEDLVEMYEKAIESFQVVDIVVVNAGVGEIGGCCKPGPIELDERGKPKKPGMTTVNINLIGVLYTAHLAQHYLLVNRADATSLKAVVFIGSIASWSALHVPVPMYVATKHAVLGLMRSLDAHNFKSLNIRTASIHPFYTDTPLIPKASRTFFAGIPLVTPSRVAGAIIHACTNPDPATSGGAYWSPGPGDTFFISREGFKLGVYKEIDKRSNALLRR